LEFADVCPDVLQQPDDCINSVTGTDKFR
jgi:hypothetical protein